MKVFSQLEQDRSLPRNSKTNCSWTVAFGNLPSPISGANILKRVLHPILKKLGIPKAGLHAFRHSLVTMLRKRGTPADLQKLWIGHSSLRTTDRYSHTDQELEYRRLAASKAGLDLVVGPNGPKMGECVAQ